MRAKGEEEAPTNKNDFLEGSKKGGVTLLGGRNFWG
jgi:hypothetical protein